MESEPGQHSVGEPSTQSWVSVLASELTGDLPCVRCGYNLRGLSIREHCPECDAPVRATILALVDPKASEFKPLRHPRRTGWGMVLWSVAALLAALGAWVIRLSELSLSWLKVAWSPSWMPVFVVGMTLLSGVGATVLLRPHAGLSVSARVRAMVGVIAYGPLAWLLWRLYIHVDAGVVLPVFGGAGASRERVLTRLGIALTLGVVILGLRPVARGLAMRSVVVRTGKVDRQSLLALLGAVAISASGDVLHLLGSGVRGPVSQALTSMEMVLVAVGSVLVTLGLAGIVIDCVRLRPTLEAPGVGIADILDEKPRRRS
ncbi:MAG: hypothetical protein ACIARR_08680 [Phycisphaerales bacterium JB059]